MTPELAEALRPHVEALHLVGVRTGEQYDALVGELLNGIYAVEDEP